jgi:hypothetical protein
MIYIYYVLTRRRNRENLRLTVMTSIITFVRWSNIYEKCCNEKILNN